MTTPGCDHGNESEDVLDTRAREREQARAVALTEIAGEVTALRDEDRRVHALADLSGSLLDELFAVTNALPAREAAAFIAGAQWADDACPVHAFPKLLAAEAQRRYPIA